MNILEEVHTYYHVTTKENYEKIKECMKLNSPFGNYVCKDINSVIAFAKEKVSSYNIHYDDVLVLEFTSKTEVEESFNHKGEKFRGVRAYVVNENMIIQDVKVIDVGIGWRDYFRSTLKPINR